MTWQPETTVCMVTYQRQENLLCVLAALDKQDPPVRVWLWNNGSELPRCVRKSVSWLIESSRNVLCPPRWWLAGQVETKFTAVLDDDLFPASDRAISNLVAHCRPGRLAGPVGASLRGRRYRDHLEVRNASEGEAVDIIKGRCVAGLTDTIRESLVSSGVWSARFRGSEYCSLAIAEDIAISGAVANGRRGCHVVPGGIGSDWLDLPEGPESLSRRRDHMDRRDNVCRRWFP